MGKAISDLKATSKLKNDNTQAFYKLSTIYYALGDHEMSLKWDTCLIGDWPRASAPFRSWSPFSPCLQWGARVPETGSRPQAVLQPLQESPKAQQADSVCRGTDPGAEVGVCHFVFICHTLTHYISIFGQYCPSSTSLLFMWNPDSSQACGNERGREFWPIVWFLIVFWKSLSKYW